MKICFFTPSLNLGGYEKFIINLVNNLEQNDIYLITFDSSGTLSSQITSSCKIIDLKVSRARYSIFPVFKSLSDIKPDIVYVSFLSTIFPVFLYKKIFNSNCKIIIGEHGIINYTKANKKLITRYIYNNSDCIIPVSEYVCQNIVRNLNIAKDKVSVIYNPVIPNNVDRLYSEPFVHKWVKNSKYILFCCVGRIEKNKGFQDLLFAFHEVEDKENKRILFVGTGSYERELKQLCIELDILEYVDFIGFTDNVYKVLREVDYLCMLSDKEGFGNVVVEGLYCYCNIVSYRGIGGPDEILKDGQIGNVIEYKDIKGLASIIQDSKKKSYDTKFKKRALEFKTKTIVQQYLEVFESVKESY